MNNQSNAMPQSFERIAPAVLYPTRPLYWSIRRELWEYRSIYIAPLAVAALVVLGFLIATIGYVMSIPDPARRATVLAEPNSFAALVIMGAAFIVEFFYCLEALHGERSDRSILFWKSLPVSDLTTVLSKASIPFVVLPLLTFAIIVVTHLIMLLLGSAVLLGSGVSAETLWTQSSMLQMPLMMLYHLVTVHVLWYAPIYGWLLLVSGWARRAAFLWAALPWLAICAVEKIAFNTTHFASMLAYRFEGGPEAITGADSFFDPMTRLTPGRFVSSPGLWIGLAIAAALLAATVRLRRYQGPI
jgi:ABC-2 type transport system permease protein